ncbi:hypothetical protein PLICRDRAFT_180429 [Plicaturopsis crispa FD-325 SS-3]|uniref:Uncharacterized protein n=1 Tax=Plicaturopsis crispa FD-325 SS-3 TaxID=944288 RepID=A0A0C9SQ51_PLICR|nr:hypothetical protein PLICRDRAFT_180429 [Plicaturopsis crispa FD-325 SS-3]
MTASKSTFSLQALDSMLNEGYDNDSISDDSFTTCPQGSFTGIPTHRTSIPSRYSRHSLLLSSSHNSSTSRSWTIRSPLGLGSLPARAFISFGEATLRGIANVIIRRRLASIASVFPHEDDEPPEGVDSMYDDLLDFARPGFYSQSIRKSAMQLLLVQIGRCATAHMIPRILDLPSVDIHVLLSELISIVDMGWLPAFGDDSFHHSLWTTYQHSAEDDIDDFDEWISYVDYHRAAPFIDFISRLAEVSATVSGDTVITAVNTPKESPSTFSIDIRISVRQGGSALTE